MVIMKSITIMRSITSSKASLRQTKFYIQENLWGLRTANSPQWCSMMATLFCITENTIHQSMLYGLQILATKVMHLTDLSCKPMATSYSMMLTTTLIGLQTLVIKVTRDTKLGCKMMETSLFTMEMSTQLGPLGQTDEASNNIAYLKLLNSYLYSFYV